MKKRMAALALMCAMVFSLLSASVLSAGAAWENDESNAELPGEAETSDTFSDSTDDDWGIMPLDNYYVIDNEDITTQTIGWTQPSDCSSYKIWIKNTTNEVMTITHRVGIGDLFGRTYKVPANSQKVVRLENSALPNVDHTLDFSVPSGAALDDVLGVVAVRVSTVNQY